MAMDTARVPVHRRVHDRVNGHVRAVYTALVHGGVTAVYTAGYTYTRPVYKTYRICNFLTQCCDYIRKQSNARYCLSPEVY